MVEHLQRSLRLADALRACRLRGRVPQPPLAVALTSQRSGLADLRPAPADPPIRGLLPVPTTPAASDRIRRDLRRHRRRLHPDLRNRHPSLRHRALPVRPETRAQAGARLGVIAATIDARRAAAPTVRGGFSMRRLAATLLCLCTSLLLASPSAHAARATIGPGVSLVFTSGWQVCNSGAALRYALPGIQRSECGMFAPNAMAMHYMASGRPIDLWISHVDNPMASETMWKGASPDEVRKVSDELCAKARSQRTTDVGSCRWDLGTIAGHTVFRQRGTVTQGGDPLKMQMEVNGFSVADGSGYTTI